MILGIPKREQQKRKHAERIETILRTVMRDGKVSFAHFADEFECSIMTIYRYAAMISEMREDIKHRRFVFIYDGGRQTSE